MSEKANRFLIELSQDPVKMEDYWKDPDSLLAAAGLTAEEKEVLRSGEPTRLAALFGPLRCDMEHHEEEPSQDRPKPKPRPKPTPKPQPKPTPKPKPKPKSEAA